MSFSRLWIFVVGLLLLSPTAAAYQYEDDDFNEPDDFVHPSSIDVQEAKIEYNRLVSYAKLPHYGTCWSNALKDMQAGCKSLTEDSQTRLAIKFANCFLEKSGLKTFPCGEQDNIQECVKTSQSEPNFFQSYRGFFSHTQNICFYIASEEWQRRAESQVNRLMDASQSVTLQLEESKVVQSQMSSQMLESHSQMLESQKTAVMSSEALVAYNEKLNESMTISQMALVANFRDLQRSASETRMWIGDIADRISRLQSIFIDEFTGFYSVIFYLISGTGCFVLTSTNRTAGSRIWLFLLLITTFFIERFCSQQKLASFEEEIGGMPDSAFVTKMLNDDAWVIRKIFWTASVAVLVYFGYKYEDMNVANHRLIMDLHKEFLSIKDMMQATNKQSVLDSGRSCLDGRESSDEMAQDSSVSIPELIRGYADRLRRSVTPSFMESESPTVRVGLTTVHEDDQEDNSMSRRSVERASTPPHRDRKSRDVTPLREELLTPRVLRSGSMSRESPAPVVRSTSNSFLQSPSSGGKRLARRPLNKREPTPEQTQEVLQQLSDITNQARNKLQEALNQGVIMNGSGDLSD